MSFIKKRHLRIAGPLNSESLSALRDKIASTSGVIAAELDPASGRLQVTYDVRQTNLENIEQILGSNGFSVARGWWERLTAGLIHFMEENERDAARGPTSPCCSHPDEVLRKAKEGGHHVHPGRSAS